jgi:geranylgeranyl pyrophosphate synthase
LCSDIAGHSEVGELVTRVESARSIGNELANATSTSRDITSGRGSETERAFWRRTLEQAKTTDADLEQAVHLMIKHRALEDTIQRARHYGAMAADALALFPPSPMKEALEEAVEFCIGRSN